MFFDYLINVKMPNDKQRVFGAWEELYKTCVDVEKNARINPDECVINIRKSMEVLFTGLYCEYKNEKIPDTLSETMKICKGIDSLWGNNKEKVIYNFYRMKEKANKIVHVIKEKSGKRQYVIKGRHATVEEASELTKKLCINTAGLFRIKYGTFNSNKLPFGDYHVVRMLDKKPYESIEGDYKYVVKRENSNIATYALIRPFLNTKDKTVYDDRDIVAQHFFKNMRGSNNIIAGDELQISNHCNIKYLKYDIQENTSTLDQVSDRITPYELLEIIEQVTKGLSGLASSTINIHHRGIRPTCIFVTKYDDGYEAKIGCFETAKIEYSQKTLETVGAYAVMNARESIFTHNQILSIQNHNNKDWEAGDVYSLAVVLISCLDPAVEKDKIISIDNLYDYYSDDFINEIDGIVSSMSLSDIPSLKEFDQILLKEINSHE